MTKTNLLCLAVLFTSMALPSCRQDEPPVPAAAHPDAERVRGTRVSLVPPAGWQPGPSFSGFMEPNTFSSLMVSSLPGPYEEASKGFHDEGRLALQRMRVLSRKPLSQGTYPGELLEITQRTNQGEFHKYIWVFGDDANTVSVMGIGPKDSSPEHLAMIARAVRTASWQPDLALDPRAELFFDLHNEGGMSLLHSTMNVLSYTSDGKIDPGGAQGKPIFIVAPAIQVTPSAPEEYMPKRMRMTVGKKKVQAGELVPVTIDGLSGLECIATCIDRDAERPAFIYQVMLFDGSSHYLMQGIAMESDRDQYLPAFQSMAHSFHRKWETVTSPDGLVSMEVPMDWTMRSGINEEAEITAANQVTNLSTTVLNDAKADLPEGWTLQAYTNNRVAAFAEGTEPDSSEAALTIAGLKASQFQFTFEGDESTYLFTLLEGKDHFYQVVQWCPTQWAEYSLDSFKRSLESLKENH